MSAHDGGPTPDGRRRARGRRARRTPADLGTADAALLDTLHSLDGAVGYRDWVLDLVRPHLAGAGAIVELGAGHGTFTSALAASAPLLAVEPGDLAFARLEERMRDDARVRVRRGTSADLADASADAVVMINVLEHIEDDAAQLADLHRVLRPGGRVVLFVPAFELLYARFDAMVGHHRRYRRAPLAALVAAQGFRVVEARYVNAIGWLLWLVYARLLGRVPTRTPVVGVYDRVVVPLVRRLERLGRPPFGQSVLCVGVRD